MGEIHTVFDVEQMLRLIREDVRFWNDLYIGALSVSDQERIRKEITFQQLKQNGDIDVNCA